MNKIDSHNYYAYVCATLVFSNRVIKSLPSIAAPSIAAPTPPTVLYSTPTRDSQYRALNHPSQNPRNLVGYSNLRLDWSKDFGNEYQTQTTHNSSTSLSTEEPYYHEIGLQPQTPTRRSTSQSERLNSSKQDGDSMTYCSAYQLSDLDGQPDCWLHDENDDVCPLSPSHNTSTTINATCPRSEARSAGSNGDNPLPTLQYYSTTCTSKSNTIRSEDGNLISHRLSDSYDSVPGL